MLVVGHHPHVIQGYERYGRGAILYSLGNLFFSRYTKNDQAVHLSQENLTGMIAEVHIGTMGAESIHFIHTRNDETDHTVKQISGLQAVRRKQFLKKLCGPLCLPNYSRFFRWYTFGRIIRRAIHWLNPRRWKNISKEHIAGISVAIQRIIHPRR